MRRKKPALPHLTKAPPTQPPATSAMSGAGSEPLAAPTPAPSRRGKNVASAIPVGTQFSPTLVNLGEFAQALVAHSGDKAAMEDAVWKPPVRVSASKKAPTRRRKSLPLEAAVQYGLLEEKTYSATDLAKKLASLIGLPLYEEFARHILLNCGGLRVLQGVEQMETDR